MWYTSSGSRYKETGKFRKQKRFGSESPAGKQYRDWSYDFISHQAGISVRRTSYNVSIRDPSGNRVEYLRGFSNLERADAAARKWIDGLLAKILRTARLRGIGTIPSLPTEPVSQEK